MVIHRALNVAARISSRKQKWKPSDSGKCATNTGEITWGWKQSQQRYGLMCSWGFVSIMGMTLK